MKQLPYFTLHQKIVSSMRLNDMMLSTFEYQGLTDTLNNICDAIGTLSSSAVLHYINNVSFLKPSSSETLCLSACIYDNSAMSSPIGVFNSSRSDCSAFIEALYISTNNQEEAEQVIVDGQSHSITTSTQWMPASIGEANSIGFGPMFNNAPVVVHLYDWMMSNSQLSTTAREFTKSTVLYLKNLWYYVSLDNGLLEYHTSDCYSQVVPTNTEQTAQLHLLDVIESSTKSLQLVNVDWSDMLGYYTIQPGQINVLVDGLDDDHYMLSLANYASGKEYKVKFTAHDDMHVDNNDDVMAVHIASGSQLIDDFNGDGTSFQAGKTYLIAIQAGMVQVLAQKDA